MEKVENQTYCFCSYDTITQIQHTNTMSMIRFYGYFSQKQKNQTGRSYVYTTHENTNVEVTEVSRSKNYIPGYDDSEFVALVENQVQKLSNGTIHYLMQISNMPSDPDQDSENKIIFDL